MKSSFAYFGIIIASFAVVVGAVFLFGNEYEKDVPIELEDLIRSGAELRDAGSNEVAQNTHLGSEIERHVSPNERFIVFVTGQGGGAGVSVYDVDHRILYIIGSFNPRISWLPDGRLRIEDYPRFESYPDAKPGEPGAVFESIDSSTPWIVEEVDLN